MTTETIVFRNSPWGDVVLLEDSGGSPNIVDEGEKFALESKKGVLTTDPVQVQDVLKAMGVLGAPVGTKIKPLREYVRQFLKANWRASLPLEEIKVSDLEFPVFECAGAQTFLTYDVELMEKGIEEARMLAQEAGIKADEAQIEAMARKGYEKGYKVFLDRAEEYAAKGSIENTIRSVVQAAECADKAGTYDFHKNMAFINVQKKSFQKHYELVLDQAEKYAAEGFAANMENSIEEARECEGKFGTVVDEARIKAIAQKGYEKGYERWLMEADLEASKGGVVATDAGVRLARKCAQEAGIEVDEAWIESILQKGYERGYEVSLDEADRSASCPSKPDAESVKQNIAMARIYAQEAGIKVDEDRIRQIKDKLPQK